MNPKEADGLQATRWRASRLNRQQQHMLVLVGSFTITVLRRQRAILAPLAWLYPGSKGSSLAFGPNQAGLPWGLEVPVVWKCM